MTDDITSDDTVTTPETPAIEAQPPVDNDHVEEGAEKFDIPVEAIELPIPAPTSTPAPETIEDNEEMSDLAKAAFSSAEFHKLISRDVVSFLNIVDIADVSQRRAALLSRNLGEVGIVRLLTLSGAFLLLQEIIGLDSGMPELVQESQVGMLKIKTMKDWLGL